MNMGLMYGRWPFWGDFDQYNKLLYISFFFFPVSDFGSHAQYHHVYAVFAVVGAFILQSVLHIIKPWRALLWLFSGDSMLASEGFVFQSLLWFLVKNTQNNRLWGDFACFLTFLWRSIAFMLHSTASAFVFPSVFFSYHSCSLSEPLTSLNPSVFLLCPPPLSQSIDPGQQFTWENSNMEVNKPKNRYANVIAYDHSRVVLTSVDGKNCCLSRSPSRAGKCQGRSLCSPAAATRCFWFIKQPSDT